MTKFTLYGHFLSVPTYKVALFLRLSNTPFNYTHIDLLTGEQKSPAHLARTDFGLIPVLEDHEAGAHISESAVILDYLSQATGALRPADDDAQWVARAWQSWAVTNVFLPLYLVRLHHLGFDKLEEQVFNYWTKAAEAGLQKLDALLEGKTWLVGEKATIADVDLYAPMQFSDESKVSLEPYQNVVAWCKRVEALPGFEGKAACVPKESRPA